MVDTTVQTFFSTSLQQCFEDLDIPDDGVAAYLADLLARFTLEAIMHPAGAAGDRVVSLIDRLREIQRAWLVGDPHFDPTREVSLRRGIGDYALFMHGFFWEHVRDMSARRHFLREGRRAYRFLAEYHRAAGRPEAAVYAALAGRFDTYAAVVSYMRDVHLGADYAPSPRTLPARFLIP